MGYRKPVSAATKAALDAKFGLNKPYWFNPTAAGAAMQTAGPLGAVRGFFDSQFFNYIFSAVRGDLGPTYQSKGALNVQDQIRDKFPYSARSGWWRSFSHSWSACRWV